MLLKINDKLFNIIKAESFNDGKGGAPYFYILKLESNDKHIRRINLLFDNLDKAIKYCEEGNAKPVACFSFGA